MKKSTLKHICLLISLLLTLAFTTIPARAQSPADVAIMQNLRDNHGFGQAFGWSTTTAPCPDDAPNWGGVTCSDGRVAIIAVGCVNNPLTTPFPGTEIASLTALISLEIRGCYINPQPAGNFAPLDTMTQLTKLRIDANPGITGNLSDIFPQGLSPTRFPVLSIFQAERTSLGGQIPAGVMEFDNTRLMRLYQARFSGTLPATGNPSKNLLINGNSLEGVLPDYIRNASGVVRLGYNKFDVVNTPAGTIDTVDAGWRTTQTVPPTNVQVTATGAGTATLTWTPIAYTAHGGYYEVLSSTAPGGPYTSRGTTANSGAKTASGLTVSGLPAGTNYFVVRTFTPAHMGETIICANGSSSTTICTLNGDNNSIAPNNPNDLTSVNSAQVSATVAASLVVTSIGDTQIGAAGCADGCTLREAVVQANTQAGADSIEFDPIVFAAPQTITLTQGIQLTIANNGALIINGTGVNRLSISGNNASRVFFVNQNANLTLNNLTVTGGRLTGSTNEGGGIFNLSGTVTLTNCSVSNNVLSGTNSANYGGGIFTFFGTLNITNSAVSNNSITGTFNDGGGIFARESTVNITGSTVSNNSASGGSSENEGGGIYVRDQVTLRITNSTISGNSVTGSGRNRGGGIFFLNSSNTLDLTSSTVSNNSAIGGSQNSTGGILNASSTINARNSIISGNTAASSPDYNGNFNVNDSNLIGNAAQVRLAPLGYYGGATETHALLSGSTAINAGNNCVATQTCANFNAPVALPADQRGASRVGNVDIGAFEANNAANGGYRVALPSGFQNSAYAVALTGNRASFSYALTDGALPTGIDLTPNPPVDGAVSLSGTPTESGTFNFGVTVSDGTNSYQTDYSLTIIDNVPPTVLLSTNAPNQIAAPFTVTATFSENVVGFELSDVAVTNGAAGSLAGSGSIYTFTVTPAAIGNVTISLPANAAQDGAGNGSAASNQLVRYFSNSPTLTVTKIEDTSDGVCDADCSLREAITVANNDPANNTINFSPAVFNTARTITLGGSELSIANNGTLTINGPGAGSLAISGNQQSRVFSVNTGANLTLNNLTVRDGKLTGVFNLGGGIYNDGGTITLTNSTVSNNSSSGGITSYFGGGIFNEGGGTVNLTNSTVSNNSINGGFLSNAGGGIRNAGSGTVNLTNSTVSNNSVSSSGGGFLNNCLGGGISNDSGGTVRARNTIIAGNTVSGGSDNRGPDFFNTLASLGNNLIGNTANMNGTVASDIINQAANLAPLGFYGGTTQTHALLPGSPAINAGNNCVLTANGCGNNNPALPTDQRGASRVGQVDIGAFEAPASLVVTNINNDGAGSLRAAITAANADPLYDAITFDIPPTDENCPSGVCTITLTSGELSIAANSALLINGTGANRLSISGNNASRVFNVNAGANLTMSGLTVTGGNPNCTGTPACSGAGIRNQGTLNLLDAAVANNTNANASGGGIINEGTAALTNCSITGNRGFSGGGLLNQGGNVYLINSTVSGNTALDAGGLLNRIGSFTIINSTVTNNTQTQGTNSGVRVQSGTLSARNSIFAGNNAATNPDFGGTLTSLGNNIIGNTAGTSGTIGSDITNVNAGLAPLGYYGGTTQTHALLSGSPAINAGTSTNAPATDQRGAGRVGNVDIGAFELNNSANGGNYIVVLPNAAQSVAYNFKITDNNGAFTYSVTGGSLPNGLNLTTNFAPNAVVALSGTPMQGGIFNFDVTASDGTNSNVTNYRLNVLAPTAAIVSVGGRVFTGKGRGLMNAFVTLTDQNGVTHTTETSASGSYRFDDIEVGQIVIVSVISRRYSFAPQVISVTEELENLDFTAF